MDISKILDAIKGVRVPTFATQFVIPKPFATLVKDPSDPSGPDQLKIPVMLVPEGFKVEDLNPIIDKFRHVPARRKGLASLKTSGSFSDFVNRNKGPDTVLFAENNLDSLSAFIRAVFNYHPGGSDQERAGWSDFHARYDFPVSEQFKAWASQSGEAMTQKDFALFLHDRIPDLGDPSTAVVPFDLGVLKPSYADPIRIFELADGLELNAKKKYYQHERVNNGTSSLQFTEEHEGADGQPLTVPNFFLLNIPVFEEGRPVFMPVRLRYAIRDERIEWTYDLWNVKLLFDFAFRDAVGVIETATSLKPFFGNV